MSTKDFRRKTEFRRNGPDREESRGKADRPTRLPGNQVWLYGAHAVLAALNNPDRKILRIIATTEALRQHGPDIDAARRAGPRPGEECLDRKDMDRLLPPGAVHQGIAALAEHLDGPDLDDVIRKAQERSHAVVIVLDQVTDPHNVGAVLRSAAAFGALAVIVPDRHSPEETGTLAKSASGALERMPLVRVTNVVRCLDDLKAGGFWAAGLAGEATQTLASAKLTGKTALVMGAEGDGMRRLTREHCDLLVRLPMTGQVESLNVSNAAAVALYELVRDQDLAGNPSSR